MIATRNDVIRLLRFSIQRCSDAPEMCALVSSDTTVEELVKLFPMFDKHQIRQLCEMSPRSRKEMLWTRTEFYRPDRLTACRSVSVRQFLELRGHNCTVSPYLRNPLTLDLDQRRRYEERRPGLEAELVRNIVAGEKWAERRGKKK